MGTETGCDALASKRAVVFYYSQTGQLTETIDAFTGPLVDAGWSIRRVRIDPASPYPFPWPLRTFFGVFPECVDPEASIDLATPSHELRSDPDELVILAYQVWYLAPSPPARTLLDKHPDIFAGRTVLSLIACRNMWYSAAVEVHRRLGELGAHPAGVVAAIDTAPQFVTFVTTLRWLLRGQREGRGRFGRAGVGEAELDRVRECGNSWATAAFDPPGAVVTYPTAAADLLAGRAFRRWGSLIRAASRRGPALRAAGIAAFVVSLTAGILVMPLCAVIALPMHRRIDRAIDRTLAGIIGPPEVQRIGIESGTAATELSTPGTELGGDNVPITVRDLSTDAFLLLFGTESEPVWLEALGYARMMNSTAVQGFPLGPDTPSSGHQLRDRSGAVLTHDRLRGGGAVLLSPDSEIATVLPGVNPHQELVRAVADGETGSGPLGG